MECGKDKLMKSISKNIADFDNLDMSSRRNASVSSARCTR